MENKNKINVNVAGRSFAVLSDEMPEHIHAVAEDVNKKITELISANPRINLDMAAILVALNLSSELKTERMLGKMGTDLSTQAALEKKIEAAEGTILELKRQLEEERAAFAREKEKLRLDWVIKEKEFLDMIEGM
ncbi:MAG: cell division protein ZapA [Clostridia bacterium]|nr:cell division protein ZapA [Clostridia bacterium]